MVVGVWHIQFTQYIHKSIAAMHFIHDKCSGLVDNKIENNTVK